ncbi:MAG: hypothetical protein AB7G21_01795 [Dehalococcoidia bacterium]
MGSRTRAAEQRVEDQRRRINALIDDLDQRVRRDVDQVRSGVTARVEEFGERIQRSGESLPGADTVRTQVNEHPMTSVVGGFGAGVALGMLSGSMMDDDDEAPRRERRAEPRHRGSGMMGGMASRLVGMFTAPALVSTVADPVQDEVRSLVKEVVAGFLGTERGRGAQRPTEPAMSSVDPGATDRGRPDPAQTTRQDTPAATAAPPPPGQRDRAWGENTERMP